MGLVVSELCAYFEHRLIAEVMHRIGPRVAVWREKLAPILSLPVEVIRYPFIISIDNDNRHLSVIKLMLSPEVKYPECAEDDAEAKAALSNWSLNKTPASTSNSTLGSSLVARAPFWTAFADADVPEDSEHPESVARSQPQAQPHASSQRVLASSIPGVPGSSPLPERATRDPFHWQQIAPLPTRTPELHAAVENANRTVQAACDNKRSKLAPNDPSLMQLRTFQEWLDECDETQLSGDAGRRHIQRSIEKVCILAVWIAADSSEDVDVPTSLWTHTRKKSTEALPSLDGDQPGPQEREQQGPTKRFKGLAGAKPQARYCC